MSAWKRRKPLGKGEILATAHFHRCPNCGQTRRLLNTNCAGWQGEPVCDVRCADCEVPVG